MYEIKAKVFLKTISYKRVKGEFRKARTAKGERSQGRQERMKFSIHGEILKEQENIVI
jgi:hypothetical protein